MRCANQKRGKFITFQIRQFIFNINSHMVIPENKKAPKLLWSFLLFNIVVYLYNGNSAIIDFTLS